MNSIFLVSPFFVGISFLASMQLKNKFNYYSKIGLLNDMSGKDIAERML